MLGLSLLGPFFGSTRAASILPPRPQSSDADARRSCQGRPPLRRCSNSGLSRPHLDSFEHGGMLRRSRLTARRIAIGLRAGVMSHCADEVSWNVSLFSLPLSSPCLSAV